MQFKIALLTAIKFIFCFEFRMHINTAAANVLK